MEELLEEQNLVMLYAVPWPPQGLYFNKEVNAVADMEGLRSDAITLKDRALLWVYVIEYISVTGVFLLSGFLLSGYSFSAFCLITILRFTD